MPDDPIPVEDSSGCVYRDLNLPCQVPGCDVCEPPKQKTATARRCVQCGVPFVPASTRASLNSLDSSGSRRLCSPECRAEFHMAQTVRRAAAMARYGAACVYCSFAPGPRREHYLTIDHFHPVILGGALSGPNLVPSCKDCNHAKDDTPPEVFLADRPEVLARLREKMAEETDPTVTPAHPGS